jgi:hypothetical protein
MSHDAALIREDPDSVPGTHVLIVGIGTYDYLLDGAMAAPDIAAGMRQIPAAARSARALADFFLDDFDNPERPLGSLAMVLSEPAPATYSHPKANVTGPLPNGDVGTVEDAIHRWVERGTARDGDLLVLYFVGHGVSAGTPLLLCRDYGKSAYNRFDGAVNLTTLLLGLGTMQSGDQLVMIDACRTDDRVARLVEGAAGALGRPVLTPLAQSDDRWGRAVQSVHFATSARTQAWAEPDGETLYSVVLLKALRGWGAQPRYGYWVGTGGLTEALDEFVPRLGRSGRVKQQPDWVRVGQFKICLPRAAMADAYVTCDPDQVWTTPLRLTADGTGVALYHQHEPSSSLREWAVSVRAGQYSFGVHFDGTSEYEDLLVDNQLVSPPAYPVRLRPSRRAK